MHALEHEAINAVIILGDRQYNNCMGTRILNLFYESDIKIYLSIIFFIQIIIQAMQLLPV